MQQLIDQLNSFDNNERSQALSQLVAETASFPDETDWLNMHMHTFFSFNGEGHSPARLAWEAKQAGLYAMAICDFDVLAGLGELLDAGDALGLRTAVGFESRTFFSEYADHDINSPGEPGVFYFMGMGFSKEPAADTKAGKLFADMLARSHTRNRDLLARINAHLGDVGLDYDADVLPLTPRGNATERHIVRAYHEKALATFNGNLAEAAVFWAAKLGQDATDLEPILADGNAASDLLRSKLMKRGGVGYVQPTKETFPALDDVIEMILDCEAIAMSTWLDGTSSGESAPTAQLECLIAKGITATNVIPDRNWDIKDADEKARKIAELDRYVAAATALDLPINIGTELNKPGQRFVDDFSAPPMQKHHAAFLKGAQVMVGQTRLVRYADFSYTGNAAAAELPGREERNAFFASVGALPCPSPAQHEALLAADGDAAYAGIRDAASGGQW
ncbi:MAG: hypothetical protein HN742_02080 [Lentisphaerae bacterium]|jgi:hypothetical protein|nr:hypothetical protein [Lentisphaerota bacterium]MBT4819246.1 hypothetical protein [Lentisphaerota bacterium]MBT5610225.1 hypothetical protein [Lentisphaerota bacterium]MBT7060045.1 hypothetical protein [Lentisphaerota bacterium]MBT7840625.1 hypothetical protein [Lentisphaerota bacterium]